MKFKIVYLECGVRREKTLDSRGIVEFYQEVRTRPSELTVVNIRKLESE